jgi:protein-tyrosine-phosphatase
MAEALLGLWGMGKFRAYSAGSYPKGHVHPIALEVLHKNNIDTELLRSKSWDEFAGTDIPQLDIVITVCGQAASEVCPVWPGQPMTVHWDILDPDRKYADAESAYRGFYHTYLELETRIKQCTRLDISDLDHKTLKKRLDDIGKIQPEMYTSKTANP